MAMLLVGTIIGAGFASGKEILSFFGDNIPFYIAPLSGLLIFGCSVLFLALSKRIKAESLSAANSKIMGRAHVAADIFLLFNSLVVLSGMLAAMDSLFSMVLPIVPAYSIISGILCALIVAKGIKGLLGGNMILVPVLIVLIVIICCFSIGTPQFLYSFRWFYPSAVIVYVSMNMMLAGTVYMTIKDLSLRQIIMSSVLAALVIAAIMSLIIFALNTTGIKTDMPLMQIALNKNKTLFYVALAAIAACIFTSMMVAMSGLTQWLKGLIGDTKYSVILVLLAGLIFSNLGFENVVSFLYPVIGVLGAVYIGICLVYFAKIRRRERRNIGYKRSGIRSGKRTERQPNF